MYVREREGSQPTGKKRVTPFLLSPSSLVVRSFHCLSPLPQMAHKTEGRGGENTEEREGGKRREKGALRPKNREFSLQTAPTGKWRLRSHLLFFKKRFQVFKEMLKHVFLDKVLVNTHISSHCHSNLKKCFSQFCPASLLFPEGLNDVQYCTMPPSSFQNKNRLCSRTCGIGKITKIKKIAKIFQHYYEDCKPWMDPTTKRNLIFESQILPRREIWSMPWIPPRRKFWVENRKARDPEVGHQTAPPHNNNNNNKNNNSHSSKT